MSSFSSIIHYASIAIQESNRKNEILGIIEPEAIPYSFATLGWKIVGIILLFFLTYLIYKAYLRYQKNAYKREAIELLLSLEKNKEIISFETISTTLKKVALISYGRDTVAALYGLNWLTFLQEKGKNTPFMKFKDQLIDVIYSNKTLDKSTSDKLLELSKKWIKTHA